MHLEIILLKEKNFIERKLLAAHPRILYILELWGSCSSEFPRIVILRPDDLFYLMPTFSTWGKLLLALTLEDDESPKYRASPRGNVDDAVRRPTLSFLVTAAPLADLLLLQTGIEEIYPAAPF